MRTLYKALLAPVMLGIVLLGSPAHAAPPPPAVEAPSGILVEAETGKIFWSRSPDAVMPPASLTKLLTALVVLEDGDLDARAPITPEARRAEGTRTYAEEGWNFTIRDHLWGLLLQSGNDSAIALAQAVGADGSMSAFTKRMNSYAQDLGARSTVSANPHGLDAPGHVSTARDLALISMAALREPLIAEMVASKTHNLKWGDGSTHTFINQNRLLWRYEGAIGIKTGYTDEAGRTITAAARRHGSTLVAVLLNTKQPTDEAIALFDWGFGSLPALQQSPVGEMALPQGVEAGAAVGAGGLEIVEVAGEPSGRSTSPASLFGPLVALGATLVIYRRLRHTARRPEAQDTSAPSEVFDLTLVRSGTDYST